jgi:DnaJ-class molecular chaperone
MDPYAALGLTKAATAAEIKKAYRKLVRDSHPDLHPDDPKAEARFKAINAAHELLKDPATRARYDAGEIDEAGAERAGRSFYRDYAEAPDHPYRPRGGFEDFGDASDIFAEMLRQRRGPAQGGPFGFGFGAAGQDVHYTLDVSFMDAARGAKARIALPVGGELEVQIPEGLRDGQTLRLRGRGNPGFAGGQPGDALVTVRVRDHPVFQRDGDDILMILPITIDEAILGSKVAAPTIGGTVNVTIPKGATSGQVLRLRGRGIGRKGGKAGDQLIELRIAMPPRVDTELQDFMEIWRRENAYNPRDTLFGGMSE